MDGLTAASIIGSGGVSLIALWRSFRGDNDTRIREVIQLEIGEDMALLNANVKRIMKKLDINGDE